MLRLSREFTHTKQGDPRRSLSTIAKHPEKYPYEKMVLESLKKLYTPLYHDEWAEGYDRTPYGIELTSFWTTVVAGEKSRFGKFNRSIRESFDPWIEHLVGIHTLGVICTDGSNCPQKSLLIDLDPVGFAWREPDAVDHPDNLRRLLTPLGDAMTALSAELGWNLKPLYRTSGNRSVWVDLHFSRPMSRSAMEKIRNRLLALTRERSDVPMGLSAEEVGKRGVIWDAGSLINRPCRIPLGIYAYTGRRGVILDPETGEAAEDEGEWLAAYRPTKNRGDAPQARSEFGPEEKTVVNREDSLRAGAFRPLKMEILESGENPPGEKTVVNREDSLIFPRLQRYSLMLSGGAFRCLERSDGTLPGIEAEIRRSVEDGWDFVEAPELARFAKEKYVALPPSGPKVTDEMKEACRELAGLVWMKLPEARNGRKFTETDIRRLLILALHRSKDGVCELTNELIGASLGWVDAVGNGEWTGELSKRTSRMIWTVLEDRPECVLPLLRREKSGVPGLPSVFRLINEMADLIAEEDGEAAACPPAEEG
jgi:hypothetical protein